MSKILIVDDDETMTSLIKTLLLMEGHEPTSLNDSTKAIEVAGSINPDLITLDLMMPGISGFDLCNLLRQDPRFAKTPILIVSARDDPASKIQAKELGASDYLAKPFNVDDFISKVKELTNSH